MPTDYIKNLVTQKLENFEQFYEISISGFKQMQSDIKYLKENNYKTLESNNPNFLGIKAKINKLEKNV